MRSTTLRTWSLPALLLTTVAAYGVVSRDATAATATGKLGGKLQDAVTSSPLAGASITVGTTGLKAISAKNGTFAIEKVPVGKTKNHLHA